MIDIHTHLLFGVDDGPETIEESIVMLEQAKAQGIDAMILTPHLKAFYRKTVLVRGEHIKMLYSPGHQQVHAGTVGPDSQQLIVAFQ